MEDDEDGPVAYVAARTGRIDAVAAEITGLSRSRVAGLIKEGAVAVGGRVVTRPAEEIPVGTTFLVRMPAPVPLDAIPQDIPVTIVYEDADLVVVDKPAGLVVHPAAGHADGTLVNARLHHIRDLSGIGGVLRPGIVHRLDRGTSGLMVVAKRDSAHVALAAQFADKTAGRRYLAITRAPLSDEGVVDAPLGRHPTDRIRFAVVAGGKRAITHWAVLGRAGDLALVECVLETGRTHQVRVHMLHLGAPLLGDGLYGKTVKVPATLRGIVDPAVDRPLLHAWQLGLVHPTTGERMRFHARPPADFLAAVDGLGLTGSLPAIP